MTKPANKPQGEASPGIIAPGRDILPVVLSPRPGPWSSYADRRVWRREFLVDEIRAVLRPGATDEETQAVAERLLALAA